MDKTAGEHAGGAGISIRNGPVLENEDHMDVDTPITNGNGTSKRKARSSISKPVKYEESDSDEAPLVCSHTYGTLSPCDPDYHHRQSVHELRRRPRR